MPELPDLIVYREALEHRMAGLVLTGLDVVDPFVLRTVDPPPAELVGRVVTAVGRIGKRLVLELEGERFAVIHLMLLGRLQWRPRGRRPTPGALATFAVDGGTVRLVERGSKRRASLRLVRGRAALGALDPGGLEPLTSSASELASSLRRERHTLKRALTDPRIVSGIGNAYSDEILHRARMSPFRLTDALDDDEMARLHGAVVEVLSVWTERLRAEAGTSFPERVTAFRDGMSVHGRAGLPCPACGSPVQRIRYAEHESNYCARCQTGGRLLADRALSRLLRADWPRTLDELERRSGQRD